MQGRKLSVVLLAILMIFALLPAAAFADGNVAKIDNIEYPTLQDAVNTIHDSTPTTITLIDDIVLEQYVNVPENANIIIDGGDFTIQLKDPMTTTYAAFNNNGSTEGLRGNTQLTLNNVNFIGHTQGMADHAVILSGAANGAYVSFTSCTFTNMYDAVYCNYVSDKNADLNTVKFTDCTFTNVENACAIDDGYTTGGRVDKHDFVFEGSTNQSNVTTFAVASVDGVGYMDLDDAIDAAANASDKTVTLRKDVEVDEKLDLDVAGLVLDLKGHKITASSSFTSSSENDSHLVDVLANDVVVKNGTLVATSSNKQTLNVYNSTGVRLENLTLNHTNAFKGAPLVVAGSSVTLGGNMTLITGSESWYAINVDSREINGTNTSADLTFDENANVVFQGVNPWGIRVENSHPVENDPVRVTFRDNGKIDGSAFGDKFVALITPPAGQGVSNIVNPGNAGLMIDPDTGVYIVHTHSVEAVAAKAATCTEPGNIAYWHCTDPDCDMYFADANLATVISQSATVIPALGHDIVKVLPVTPTADQPGNIEYWYCNRCGKYFLNEALTHEIIQKDTIIPATGAVSSVPQTGDDFSAVRLFALMMGTGMACIAMVLKKKLLA